jgi:hypothetical protein
MKRCLFIITLFVNFSLYANNWTDNSPPFFKDKHWILEKEDMLTTVAYTHDEMDYPVDFDYLKSNYFISDKVFTFYEFHNLGTKFKDCEKYAPDVNYREGTMLLAHKIIKIGSFCDETNREYATWFHFIMEDEDNAEFLNTLQGEEEVVFELNAMLFKVTSKDFYLPKNDTEVEKKESDPFSFRGIKSEVTVATSNGQSIEAKWLLNIKTGLFYVTLNTDDVICDPTVDEAILSQLLDNNKIIKAKTKAYLTIESCQYMNGQVTIMFESNPENNLNFFNETMNNAFNVAAIPYRSKSADKAEIMFVLSPNQNTATFIK